MTIADVARKAGVSKVTVSYVMNGREGKVRISDETRRRIWEAIRELGYRPNAVARALTQRRTHTIGVVMQYAAIFGGWSGFILELLHGASHEAIDLQYDLMMYTGAHGDDAEHEANAVMDGRIDGALLLRDIDDPLSDILADSGFPHVVVFTRARRPDVYSVDCDNVQGGYLATKHLLGLGHRAIVHLRGSSRSAPALDRWHGYVQAMREAGIEPEERWVLEMTAPLSDATPLVELMRSRHRPTAIFAWSDDVAIRAMQVLRDLGLRIPEDVAVVGYDSTEVCNHTDPPLTSVRQPIYEMAREGVKTLVRLIEGERPHPVARIFEPVLDIRRSCGSASS
ncbi:MAG: LacI family transcriptional regulator [Armatimonadota bacterium]|nr:MAG: LacI family transcriptional regulator [Armatimonadota bacterium]